MFHRCYKRSWYLFGLFLSMIFVRKKRNTKTKYSFFRHMQIINDKCENKYQISFLYDLCKRSMLLHLLEYILYKLLLVSFSLTYHLILNFRFQFKGKKSSFFLLLEIKPVMVIIKVLVGMFVLFLFIQWIILEHKGEQINIDFDIINNIKRSRIWQD